MKSLSINLYGAGNPISSDRPSRFIISGTPLKTFQEVAENDSIKQLLVNLGKKIVYSDTGNLQNLDRTARSGYASNSATERASRIFRVASAISARARNANIQDLQDSAIVMDGQILNKLVETGAVLNSNLFEIRNISNQIIFTPVVKSGGSYREVGVVQPGGIVNVAGSRNKK